MIALVKKHLSFWDIGVLLMCILFVLSKIPFLGLPYFWDEAWVYAPAVFDMYENGPSLSPDSINPELSRGHPILFHFLAVCWMTIFGSSFTVTHSFSVFVAILTIVAVYKLGEELHSKAVGFWAALLFSVQPMFIAQAGFLLPEVLLTLLVVLTTLFYLKRALLGYILTGTAMLLTKETGALVIATLCLVELFEFVRERNFRRKRVLEFLATGSPVFLAFLYFLVQYYQFGWFMFPEHMSMFDMDSETWSRKKKVVFNILFFEQNRNLVIGFALAAGALAWQKSSPFLRILLLMCGLTFFTMNSLDSWLPDWYYYNVFPMVVFLSIILTGREMIKGSSKLHLFVPFVGIVTVAMVLFTSAHFVIDRYLLFLTPLLITACVVLVRLSMNKTVWLFMASMIFLGGMQYHYMNRVDGHRTHMSNMRYVDEIHVMQKGFQYLEENTDYGTNCYAGSFLIHQALVHPVQGYVKQDNTPNCVFNYVAPEVDYALLISFEKSPKLEWLKTDSNFQQVFVESRGIHTAWVYKRIGD